MNLGFDAKRAFYNRSGLGNYSRHTIEILSDYFPDNKYLLYTPIKRNPVNFTITRNNLIRYPRGFNIPLYHSWRTHRIIRDLKRDKIDLYHGLSNELPYTIKKAGIKSVVTIHDLIFMRFPEFYYSHDREIYKSKFLKSCQNADRIIAISNQTKQDIVHFFEIPEEKIEVVYQGCDPIYKQEIPEEKLKEVRSKYNLPQHFILNVGTIEKRKNIFTVIQAMYEDNIEIPMVVVGRKTAYLNEILAYVEKYGLEKQFYFYHKIPFEDLPAFYKLSELMIFPSLFEGFGIPIVEALNMGIPVITNKDGCFPEAGGPSSIYIDPQNKANIADAIKNVLSDPEQKAKIVEEGYDYVKKFSEENIAHNLNRVYQSVLSH